MGSQMKGNGPPPEKEVIHSGHFMSTVVHEEPNPSITPLRDGQIRFQIDSSLQRLFECMNEAYKNGVTTPRWKNFNGMKIRLKDRIRLNNAIWRCWHIEYAEPASGRRSKPKFIQFITPLDSVPAQEVKPQVTILEEEFWKKRNKAVVSEYITWRKFYWKNAAERLRNQRELRKTPEPNYRPVYQPTDAWVIDDGFFSDIYDTLHSHAMPDDNYSNPHDMSRYGFDTSCFGSFSVVDDLCPPIENQVIFMDNQDYKKPPVVNIEYDDRTSSSSLNSTPKNNNSLSIPSKQLQSVQSTVDDQQQQQTSMVSNGLNQELHYVPNHEPLKQETYLLKPDNHNNTFKQPVNIPVQNHDYQRIKQQQQPPRQSPIVQKQQTPVEIAELRPPPTKRRRSSEFEQYENLHPETAQQNGHHGGVPIQNQHNYNPNYKSEPYMSQGHHHGQVHTSRHSPNLHDQGNGTAGLVRGSSGGHSLDSKGMVASMVDKSGMVEMPDGSKVVLMTQLEDGSYVQIKGEGASKVIFTSQQKSAPSPPPLPPRDIRPLPPQQNQHTINGNNMSTSISPRPSSSSYHSRSPSISSYSLTDMTTEQSLANMDAYKSERKEDLTTYEEIPAHEYDYKIIETGFEQQDPENLSAEQKRRFTMKKGFERLESLVNGDVGANGPKMSKAAVLSKAKDHIQKARSEQKRLRQEIDLLRRETENLQQQISQSQDQLPEKGVPMNKPRVDKIQRQYENFISESTRKNYKFYVFSRIMKRLFESYATVVSTENTTKLQSSARQWVNVQCSMSNIRQISAESLRHLTTETCIVDDRLVSRFPMECVQLADRESAGPP